MEKIFQLVGSIASIGSIPLAIYLYLKSKETKFDKTKNYIIRTLSYQIGENRILGTFEIETVIKSKLRENNIKEGSITIDSVIEDLVTETISNPLIESDRKSEIISNLKSLYFKAELFNVINDIEKTSIKSVIEESNPEKRKYAEKNISNSILNKLENLDLLNSIEKDLLTKSKISNKFSATFATVAGVLTFIVSVFSLIGDKKIKTIFSYINFDNDMTFIFAIIVSFLVTVLSSLVSIYIKNRKKK